MTKDIAIKELIFKIADDAMILGHRNSEWTGIGPTLEEDIAFSSMSQDKIGHAYQLYKILHEQYGEASPDELAFKRDEKAFKSCHFVEIPTTDYAFSLVRHFLFDYADALRFEALQNSSVESLKQLANKVKGEIKYHTMHANVWVKMLGQGNEESKARMQTAINEAMPYALGIFEPSENEAELIEAGVYTNEEKLKEQWLNNISELIEKSGLKMPDVSKLEPVYGGRKGYHSEHLAPLLLEMTEVMRIDPNANW